MFAGVPRTIPSAASRSDAVAASAARHTTSTPPISGSRAPDTTESSSSAVAGDGVWWTIRSRVTASAWWPVAERGRPAGRTAVPAPPGLVQFRGDSDTGDTSQWELETAEDYSLT